MGNALVQSATIQLKDQGGGVFGSVSGGGGADLEYTGTPSQLGAITINTNGAYSFGTRSVEKMKYYQAGDKAWGVSGEITLTNEVAAVNDELLTTSAGYHQMNMQAVVGSEAGKNTNFAYGSYLDGREFGEPSTAGTKTSPDAATTKKNLFYQSTRFNTDLTYTVTSSYTGLITGTFTEGDLDLFTKGERVTITKSGGGSIFGNCIAVDTTLKRVTFELDFGETYNSGDNNGATIDGDVSGATVDFDGVTYIRPDGTKLLRTGSSNGVIPTDPADLEYALIVTAAGQHALDVKTQAGGRDDERPNANAQVSTEYQSRLWFVDASTPIYSFSSFLEGSRTDYDFTNSASYDFNDITKQLAIIDICVEWPGSNNPSGHLRSRTNTVVLDYEYNSVLLGNAATFSASTKISLCRNIAWSDTSAEIMLHYGEITGETFVYILDGNGEVVNPTAGLSIGSAP